MSDLTESARAFAALHEGDGLFVMPNPWDVGSARLMAGLGFQALATSSWAAAMSAGRRDGAGQLTLDVALAHAAEIIAATDLPVSADLEDGFGRSPESVRETVTAAVDIGLAGCSIEDTTADTESPIHELGLAVERIQAAVEAARSADRPFTLTARADGLSYGRPSIDDIVARLQAFEAAGADVLYAPELPDLATVRMVCASVEKPVNAIAGLGLPPDVSIADLEHAGVKRLSLGSSPYRAAAAGLLSGLNALRDHGDLTPLATGAPFGVVEELIERGTPT